MPLYLVRFSYTPESWKKLVANPENRHQVVGKLAEQLGGRLQGFWYAFGEHDGYILVEVPDNVAAAELAVAATAGSGIRSTETTVLMTVEELLEALKKAADVS